MAKPYFPENFVVDNQPVLTVPRAQDADVVVEGVPPGAGDFSPLPFAADAMVETTAPGPMDGINALADIPDVTDRTDLIPSKQVRFEGQWLPDADGTELGPGNYQTLQNCRYQDHHVEGVLGYTKLNMKTMYVVDGFGNPVYRTTDGVYQIYVSDTENHILIHTVIPGEPGEIRVADLAGDFDDIIFTDSVPGGLPRFSPGPLGSIIYSNGIDPHQVWSGEEMVLGAFIGVRQDIVDPTLFIPTDHTEKVRYLGDDRDIQIDAMHTTYYVGSPRKLQGMTVYGNVVLALTALDTFVGGDVWNALPYTVTSVAPDVQKVDWDWDDTAQPKYFMDYYLYWYRIAFQPMATGIIDMITMDAPIQPLNNLWDGVERQPIAFHVVLENPINDQDFTLQVNVQSSDDNPVGAVIDSNTLGGAKLGYLLMGFEEPVTAVKFRFITDRVNHGVTTAQIYVDTPVGWSIVAGTAITDGTAVAGESFTQNGVISWSNPAIEPVLKDNYGVSAYWYKIVFTVPLRNFTSITKNNVTFNAALGSISHSGTSLYDDGFRTGDIIYVQSSTFNDGPKTIVSLVQNATTFYVAEPLVNEAGTPLCIFLLSRNIIIDTVTGVPQHGTIDTGQFTVQFDNRLFIASDNRFEYSAPGTTDVWNGQLSSQQGLAALYVGGSDDIMAAAQLYNRFGSSIYGMLLTLKKTETFIILGTNPEDFRIYPVSMNVGCPAPNTLAVAEMGYQMADAANRNVAMWLSFTGPYMMDGAIISPIPGVGDFFDKTNPNGQGINFDMIHKAVGWYDQENFEYNLTFPSAFSLENDVWLCYDLIRRKWFEKVPDGRSYPVSAGITRTRNGEKIVYIGTGNGHVLREENGTTWNDIQEWNEYHDYPIGYTVWNRADGMMYTALAQNRNDIPPSLNWGPGGPPGIEQVVKTGDFYPSGDIWDTTILRRIMVFCRQIQESRNLEIRHFPDTRSAFSVPAPAPPNVVPAPIAVLPVAQGSNHRVLQLVASCNHTGWCHCLEFRITTSATLRGLKLLGFGTQAWAERMEE